MLKPGLSTNVAVVICVAAIAGFAGCSQNVTADPQQKSSTVDSPLPKPTDAQAAGPAPVASSELVLAGGCFWCMEAGFEQLRGVSDVVSGYAGGSAQGANYRTVASGLTSHAEAIRITYDPQVISEETLLKVFFLAAHDPTQLNRQGPDVGRQYRSAVFYSSDEQKLRVERMIADFNASGKFEQKIATTVEPLKKFYTAEDYHQDFARLNPDQPYVTYHSRPNAERVCKAFPELVRQVEELDKKPGNSPPDGGESGEDTSGSESTVP